MGQFSDVNSNYRYILTVIDVMSKFSWCRALLNKKTTTVSAAMETIFIDSHRVPSKLHSDGGSEFKSKTFTALMRKYKIHHYQTYSELKASVVERYNRSLKEIMWKRFSLQGNYEWFDKLQEFVDFYNSRFHRTIQMRPCDVRKDQEIYLRKKFFNPRQKLEKKLRFKLGDYVRTTRKKVKQKYLILNLLIKVSVNFTGYF